MFRLNLFTCWYACIAIARALHLDVRISLVHRNAALINNYSLQLYLCSRLLLILFFFFHFLTSCLLSPFYQFPVVQIVTRNVHRYARAQQPRHTQSTEPNSSDSQRGIESGENVLVAWVSFQLNATLVQLLLSSEVIARYELWKQ